MHPSPDDVMPDCILCLAVSAASGVKYWLILHSGIIANCIVFIVSLVACLLPAHFSRGRQQVTLSCSFIKHDAH
jgi:hypothetical protein